MGLFSFLKEAGKGLLSNKKQPAAPTPEEKAKANQELAELLRKEIEEHGFEVKDLVVDVDDDKVFIAGEVESQDVKEKIVLLVGNVEGVAVVEERLEVVAPAPEAQFYTVQKGDSLSKIAKQFYGDPMKYPIIFEANKPMLKDPNLIYPGQVLRIPPLEEQQ